MEGSARGVTCRPTLMAFAWSEKTTGNIQLRYNNICIYIFIHSFSSLSYDRSKASSKASSPHSAI